MRKLLTITSSQIDRYDPFAWLGRKLTGPTPAVAIQQIGISASEALRGFERLLGKVCPACNNSRQVMSNDYLRPEIEGMQRDCFLCKIRSDYAPNE